MYCFADSCVAAMSVGIAIVARCQLAQVGHGPLSGSYMFGHYSIKPPWRFYVRELQA